MCDLEYEATNPLKINNGKLQAFGNTVMFMSDYGNGFAINEGERGEVIAQILCEMAYKNARGESVIRGVEDYRSGRHLETGSWIHQLMTLQRLLLEGNVYKKRQAELWRDNE